MYYIILFNGLKLGYIFFEVLIAFMTSEASVYEVNHFEIQHRPILRKCDIVQYLTINKDVGQFVHKIWNNQTNNKQ